MKIGTLILGAAIGVLIAIAVCALTGCGSTMRLEYGQPDGKAVAFELKLPEKKGYQK